MGAINFFAVMAPAVGPYLGGVLLDDSDSVTGGMFSICLFR